MAIDPIELKIRITKGKCAAIGCRRETGGGKLCSTCRSRKSRLSNLHRYAYNNLKSHSKARGIPFDLTLDEFIEYSIEHRYIQSKSRQSDGQTIDRINDDPALGYHGYSKSNIQPKTNRDNVLKEHEKRKRIKKLTLDFTSHGIKWTVVDDSKIKSKIQEDETDLPF